MTEAKPTGSQCSRCSAALTPCMHPTAGGAGGHWCCDCAQSHWEAMADKVQGFLESLITDALPDEVTAGIAFCAVTKILVERKGWDRIAIAKWAARVLGVGVQEIPNPHTNHGKPKVYS